MVQEIFSMMPQKPGRMKYLLLTMGIPVLLSYLVNFLVTSGLLPNSGMFRYVYAYFPIVGLAVLGYFLIIRKNHTIDISGNSLTETDWLRKHTRELTAGQISGIRINILKEIILLGEDGKKLLCVEANMTNFDLFQQWLVSHNLYQHKEK